MVNKAIILSGMISIMISCNKPISSLEKKELKYQELPKIIKDKIFYSNGLLQDIDNPNDNDFQEINTPKRYEYYTRQNFFFAWVYEGYIKNKETGKVYSLKQESGIEMGSRCIVYGDSLYIPNHYNIHREDSLNYTFTRFILK